MAARLIAGVDEAGRGPLAGPVVAAAVILGERSIDGLADSKILTRKRRAELDTEIRANARAFGVAIVDHHEIDRLNILQATFLAMRRAVAELGVTPDLCLIDGNRQVPDLGAPQKTIVDGDAAEPCISAASILAKVCRDRLMEEQDALYPGYGFAQHKGYSCPEHFEAIRRLGPCEIHRRSFSPIREMVLQPTLWPTGV